MNVCSQISRMSDTTKIKFIFVLIIIFIVVLIMFRTTSLIFILCSVVFTALSCDWLTHYSDLRNSSMTLIQVMGGNFTNQQCRVPFPYKLYKSMEKKEVESQLLFIRDSLKQIFDLYRYSNLSSTTWDSAKTWSFLESINRQMEELDRCILNHQHKQRTNSRVKEYFRKLKDITLYRTGGEIKAGWEILRKETKYHLDQLDLLGNRLI